MWANFFQNIAATKRQYWLYVGFYLPWGFTMNALGKLLQIAEFVNWWQVISCYVICLVPASLLVRRLSLLQQYLYGLLVMAPIELGGYSLGTSRAFDQNIIDRIFSERNFALVMVVFFGASLPFGNRVVAWLERVLFGQPKRWL